MAQEKITSKKELKKKTSAIPFRKHEKSEGVTSSNIILTALDSSKPTEGMSLAKVAIRGSIINKITDVHPDSTVVEFSESEVKEVKEAIEATKWAVPDLFITVVAADFGCEWETAE